MGSVDVLLMTTEEETAAATRLVLDAGAIDGTVTTCKNVTELRTRLAKSGAQVANRVALVDIDPDPHRLLFDLSRIITTYPRTPFVVISREFSEKLVLQAMQAGARHFLRKGSIETELNDVLGRLLAPESDAHAPLGELISVFSSGGGCGATTVAVNLANELRLSSSNPTLIVDLDHHYGSVAGYLGAAGSYGIAHLLSRKDTVDKHLIQSSATPVIEGLDILLSPAVAEADTVDQMDFSNLLKVLDVCRESHGYVVVDAPRVPQQTMADLASTSHVAVVVFQLTVRDVSVAQSIVSFLTEHGMTRDRIVPLANRVRKRGPLLRLEDSERVIGIRPLYCVRSDWRRAVQSINHGQPLADSARRSGLRKDFRRIATQIQRWTVNGS